MVGFIVPLFNWRVFWRVIWGEIPLLFVQRPNEQTWDGEMHHEDAGNLPYATQVQDQATDDHGVK